MNLKQLGYFIAFDRLKNFVKVNLQKLNNQHKKLRHFLGKFNGVSSKYLQNHLNWFAYGKNMESYANQTKQWFLTILTTDIAYTHIN